MRRLRDYQRVAIILDGHRADAVVVATAGHHVWLEPMSAATGAVCATTARARACRDVGAVDTVVAVSISLPDGLNDIAAQARVASVGQCGTALELVDVDAALGDRLEAIVLAVRRRIARDRTPMGRTA